MNSVNVDKSFLAQPRVLVLIIVLFIISSLAGIGLLTFLLALCISFSVLSHYFLKHFHNKVTWEFKKYVNISSVDESVKGIIEIENKSSLPVHNFKIAMESNSEKEIVFINDGNDLVESSMYSKTFFLPPKSQNIIEFHLKGKSRGNHHWTNFNMLISDPIRLRTLRLGYANEFLPTFPVMPRIIKVDELKIKSVLQGYRNTNHSFFMDESSIVGTKDYENESFRHIHWMASAKENKLLAKKYQKVNGSEYSILLNLVGKGQFHLRRDMEDLIEYATAVSLYLIKEGCKIELLVNYCTKQNEILRIENDIDRSQLKNMIMALSMINERGIFLPSEQFYRQAFSKKDKKSLALVIGSSPEPTKIDKWLQIKQ
jgi:uncharacterized protein (DUF58 family)